MKPKEQGHSLIENVQNFTILTDNNGMIGRECKKCNQYFKVKINTCISSEVYYCPYCDNSDESLNFFTKDQSKSLDDFVGQHILETYIKPALDNLDSSILPNKLDDIFFTFTYDRADGIKKKFSFSYQEKDLQTNVICDKCGVEFSIYGVFARCPVCAEINAFTVFDKSIEAITRLLNIDSQFLSKEQKEDLSVFAIEKCISTFDGLGKELIERKPSMFKFIQRNLFQNLWNLDKSLSHIISIQHIHFKDLCRMFQVRHIYTHNLGVIDQDFVSKVPSYVTFIGRKYELNEPEIVQFIADFKELGNIIKRHFQVGI